MKLNCFILRTTAVAGLGVPIFRVITVEQSEFKIKALDKKGYLMIHVIEG